MAAASSGSFPQQSYGIMPPYLQAPPGLGTLPQALLPGHFGMLQPPGVSPSAALLQPQESNPLGPGGSLPMLPGLSDQPFMLQPLVLPQQAEQGAGQSREGPHGAVLGQDGPTGPEGALLLPTGILLAT